MLLLAPVLLHQQPVDKPTLKLYQQRFVLRTPTELIRVPLVENPDLPPAIMYRRGDAYAVWDERGLTVRAPGWSVSTRLPEIASSSKVFSRNEILQTGQMVKQGIRSLEAGALSGSIRVGPNAYFLLRWDERSGKPWCEALVAVDLTIPKPKPRLIGRFTGLTMSDDQIGTRLFALSGDLAVVTTGEAAWGLATYNIANEHFDFRKYGSGLSRFWPKTNQFGYFVERVPGAGSVAGRIDFATGLRKQIWQSKGLASFVDTETPELLTSYGDRTEIFLAGTGAARELRNDTVVRRAGKYVVAWSPSDTPTEANAYDPASWTVIATWTAKPVR